MPLTTPPTRSAPLYARSKTTGETFLVGPSTSMIDDLGDVDTSTTGPSDGQALVWDAAAGQWVPGDVGLEFWDPFVNYEVGDQVLWPDVAPSALWQAYEDNIGIEPVPAGAYTPPALMFGGAAAGGGNGIQSTVGTLDISAGFEAQLQTDGTIGTGTLVSLRSGGFPQFELRTTATGLQAFLDGTATTTADRLTADFASLNHIRVQVTATTITFKCSEDGVTWTDAGTPTAHAVGTPAQPTQFICIGHDGTSNAAACYAGALRAVELSSGMTLSSWVVETQPDPFGGGISPKTGELYDVIDPNGVLVEIPAVGIVGPWQQLLGGASKLDDLTDVDTSTIPPAPGDGLIWDGTNWVPGPGGSEVEVADVEPTTNVAWELWADVSDTSPTDPVVLGLGMNDLTDADTTSTPPIPGNVLAWTGTQWMPGIASSVDALDDLFDVDTSTVAPVDGDTLVYDAASLTWVPGAGGVRAYRETIAVATFPATLTVAHGLNVATVSTTVVAAGPPRAQVTAEVELTDTNTATITLATGTVGDYEVLVLG